MLDDDGQLEIAAIQAERFFDYSTNLVNNSQHHPLNCVETVPEDVLIIVEEKQYYSIPFLNDDCAVPKVEELTAHILNDYGFFLIKIKDCTFTTSYPFPAKEPNQSYQLQLRVHHTPNVINLCHFQFQCWSDYNNKGSLKIVKPGNMKPDTFREQIIHAIRNWIIDNMHSVNAVS